MVVNIKLTKSEVLRKCIIVFDAIRRATSKGGAGLVPDDGKETSFYMDQEICDRLREMLLEAQWAEHEEAQKAEEEKRIRRMQEARERKEDGELKDWQKDVMENGPPERLDLK